MNSLSSPICTLTDEVDGGFELSSLYRPKSARTGGGLSHAFPGFFGSIAKAIGSAFKGVERAVRGTLKGVAKVVKAVVKAVVVAAKSVVSIIAESAGTVVGFIAGAFSQVQGFLQSPFGAVIAGIAVVVAVMFLLPLIGVGAGLVGSFGSALASVGATTFGSQVLVCSLVLYGASHLVAPLIVQALVWVSGLLNNTFTLILGKDDMSYSRGLAQGLKGSGSSVVRDKNGRVLLGQSLEKTRKIARKRADRLPISLLKSLTGDFPFLLVGGAVVAFILISE